MPRKLKVYAWTGARRESIGEGNRHSQTREIVAAPSVAEVRRIAGLTRSEWEHSGGETGNAGEVGVAMDRPGVVFWKPLNQSLRETGEWVAVEPKVGQQ